MKTVEIKKTKIVLTIKKEIKITKLLKELVNKPLEYNCIVFRTRDMENGFYDKHIDLCYSLQDCDILENVTDSWHPTFEIKDMKAFKKIQEMCNEIFPSQ